MSVCCVTPLPFLWFLLLFTFLFIYFIYSGSYVCMYVCMHVCIYLFRFLFLLSFLLLSLLTWGVGGVLAWFLFGFSYVFLFLFKSGRLGQTGCWMVAYLSHHPVTQAGDKVVYFPQGHQEVMSQRAKLLGGRGGGRHKRSTSDLGPISVSDMCRCMTV